MRIAVTGGSGFIGSNLVPALVSEGHEVLCLVRSLPESRLPQVDYISVPEQPDLIGEVLRRFRIDGVVHLASVYIKDHKAEEIDRLIDSNVRFPTRLLEACVQSQVKWFVNTGTFWQHYGGRDYSPANLYAATKEAFEVVAQYYRETSDTIIVTLKLNDTYGPHDVRPKIFAHWTKLMSSGGEMEMSAGDQLVDIVHVDDVVRAYQALIGSLGQPDRTNLQGRCFAVSSGRPISLRHLARVFESAVGRPLPIRWGAKPYRPREVMVPWASGVPVPGWQPRVSLEDGIRSLFQSEAQGR